MEWRRWSGDDVLPPRFVFHGLPSASAKATCATPVGQVDYIDTRYVQRTYT